MFDSLKFTPVKSNIFSTITIASIILLIIFTYSIISNVSLNSVYNPGYFKVHKIRFKPQELALFDASDSATKFDSKIKNFFITNQCKVHVFMTWISPLSSLTKRDFLGLQSLFQTNPNSCLIILSSTMDSIKGHTILTPLISRGFVVRALTPNLRDLFKNTPVSLWYSEIKNGKKDAGQIPLSQNLSNLIRLAVLYKYGGVYLDMDFIILKDLSGLRNSIGAQSVDRKGNWTRLNNAVLFFDKGHPILYKFMEEFALTFDGNKWGHNGPYLVSRVVNRLANSTRELNITIFPPMAFYPVDWTRIGGFFARHDDRVGGKWVEAKIRQLCEVSYGVHLWNRQSNGFKIEEGSILSRLIAEHCVICNRSISSS